jgi:3-deoxy-D-manno-octulosonic-acid transferase
MKFIIAPHEIDKENLADIRKEFPAAVFYSELEQGTNPEALSANILIIDNIGKLSRLYKYAAITYIGGGFGADGVHNVLEAAVYGKPVIFGPVYEKFDEAVGLVDAGGAVSYSDPLGLEAILDEYCGDDAEIAKMGKAAQDFVYANRGATETILAFIQEKRLLTS